MSITYCSFDEHNDDGPGYVMSRKNLAKLAVAIKEKKCNNNMTGSDDNKIGDCLRFVNLTPGETINRNDRLRFFPVEPLNTFDGTLESPK